LAEGKSFLSGRLLVVAFEGWNDAGEAASGAVRTLQDVLSVTPIAEVDPELYFDYQFNRPTVSTDDDGRRRLEWPTAIMYGPSEPGVAPHGLADDAQLQVSGNNVGNIYLLLGTEPSRSWKSFTAEILDAALAADISAVVFLGAMLADVPHTRPISIFASSENAQVRSELQIERSTYEGPVRRCGNSDGHDLGIGAALCAQRSEPQGDAGSDRQARRTRRCHYPAWQPC
jgi:hypothetical protein